MRQLLSKWLRLVRCKYLFNRRFWDTPIPNLIPKFQRLQIIHPELFIDGARFTKYTYPSLSAIFGYCVFCLVSAIECRPTYHPRSYILNIWVDTGAEYDLIIMGSDWVTFSAIFCFARKGYEAVNIIAMGCNWIVWPSATFPFHTLFGVGRVWKCWEWLCWGVNL